jgi:hypothetical protein
LNRVTPGGNLRNRISIRPASAERMASSNALTDFSGCRGLSMTDDQTDHDQWLGGSADYREINQEKLLPCRGCTRVCSRYGHCDGRPWRIDVNNHASDTR